MKKGFKAATVAFVALWCSGSLSASPRSPAVRAEFQRLNPCPSTGERRGPCPGFQADHIRALVCGGGDEPQNLQWLTDELHRQKTRADVAMCKHQATVRP